MTELFRFPEGATPISDCSDLITPWVTHVSDLNRVESQNILKAQTKYLKDPVEHPELWFHIKGLRAMHKTMFGEVWNWAGRYRKSITSIGVNPTLIPYKLAEFCIEVSNWWHYPVELTFLEMAARIHHRLVFIHPFENGNGRFSRLVANRYLKAFKCPCPLWPNNLHKEGIIRRDYIQTLKSADHGDYEPLVDLMKLLGGRNQISEDSLKN